MKEICNYVKLYTSSNVKELNDNGTTNSNASSTSNNNSFNNSNIGNNTNDNVKLFPTLDGFVHGIFITDTFAKDADATYGIRYKTYLIINDNVIDQTDLTGSILRYKIDNTTIVDQYRFPSVNGRAIFLTTDNFTAVSENVYRGISFSNTYYDLGLYVFDKQLSLIKGIQINTYTPILNPVNIDYDSTTNTLVTVFRDFSDFVILKTDSNLSSVSMKSIKAPTLRNILDVKVDNTYIYVLLADYNSNQFVILDKSLNLIKAKKTKKDSPFYKKLYVKDDKIYLFGNGRIAILDKNNIDNTIDVSTFDIEDSFSIVRHFNNILDYLFDNDNIYMALGTSDAEHLVIARLNVTSHALDIISVISITNCSGYSCVLGYIGDNDRLYVSLSMTINNTKHHFHFNIPVGDIDQYSFSSTVPNTSSSIEIKNYLSDESGKASVGNGSFSFDSDTTSSLQVNSYTKNISEVTVTLNKTSINIDKSV